MTSPAGSRGATFGCLLLGGLVAEVSTAQGWWRAAGGGAAVVFKGTEATGGLSQALAVVALAGTLLVLVLKARGRRVVAVLLALAGIGMTVVGVLRLAPGTDAVRTRMRQVSLADTYALSPTSWPEVFAVAGLLVLAGSVLLWRGAPRWVARPDRFARSPGGEPSAAAPVTALSVADDPAGAWRALDVGVDPTVTDDPAASARAIHPDVPDVGLRGHNVPEEVVSEVVVVEEEVRKAPIRERGV